MIDLAREQWADGERRLARDTADPIRHAQLEDLVSILADELRKRLGRHFTLAELAELHGRADDWAREVVSSSLPAAARVGFGDVVLVLDAACYRYARGAGDYRP